MAASLVTAERGRFALACAVVAIGVLWRCYRLNAFPALDPDEVEGVLAWFRDPPILWYVYPTGRPHLNPLGPILLWPFATFASPAPWVVRMPALLAGLSLLPVTFLVVRKAFGRSMALPATLLVSSAPILIAYSRQAWDLAFVPPVTVLTIGLAFQRRLVWAGASMVFLVLIHPTAAFVMTIVAAPFVRDRWVRSAGSRYPFLRRAALCVVSCLAYAAAYVALAALVAQIPLDRDHVPQLLGLVGERLGDTWVAVEFVSYYCHALTGGFVYAEFLGSHVPTSTIWPVLALATLFATGVYVLWDQGRADEVTLLIAIPCALLAQYVSMGTEEVMSPLKERYFLWAIVPSCWALVFVLHGFCARLKATTSVLTITLGLSFLWLGSFYVSYLRPFEREGGMSASLDYRSAVPQPKEQVLQIIRSHRQYPAADAKVFVGESRLQLGLTYLASRDRDLEIKNLGRVLYQHQRDDQSDLLKAYAEPPQDVFFVDYAWDELQGEVREIHALGARPVATAVTPWTAHELQAVHTTDGRPLLKVWRLSRDQ